MGAPQAAQDCRPNRCHFGNSPPSPSKSKCYLIVAGLMLATGSLWLLLVANEQLDLRLDLNGVQHAGEPRKTASTQSQPAWLLFGTEQPPDVGKRRHRKASSSGLPPPPPPSGLKWASASILDDFGSAIPTIFEADESEPQETASTETIIPPTSKQTNKNDNYSRTKKDLKEAREQFEHSQKDSNKSQESRREWMSVGAGASLANDRQAETNVSTGSMSKSFSSEVATEDAAKKNMNTNKNKQQHETSPSSSEAPVKTRRKRRAGAPSSEREY